MHPAPSDGSSVSVIVPTFHEVENIPHLIARLQAVREATGLDLELLLMDDDSRDGIEALTQSLALDWVTLVIRKEDRGLSRAVLEGLKRSEREFVVVMDADLSHPPEKIPELLAAVRNGAEVAVGFDTLMHGPTAS